MDLKDKPKNFKSLVYTIPPRGHVLGVANIAIVDAVERSFKADIPRKCCMEFKT